MWIWFSAPPPVDIVRACSKTGGSSDPDHSTEERHQEASDRLHGPSTTEPGSGCRPHREFYHVSMKKRDWSPCRSIDRWRGNCSYQVDFFSHSFPSLSLIAAPSWICTRCRNCRQCSTWVCPPSTRWFPLWVRTHCDTRRHASTSPPAWRSWDRCVRAASTSTRAEDVLRSEPSSALTRPHWASTVIIKHNNNRFYWQSTLHQINNCFTVHMSIKKHWKWITARSKAQWGDYIGYKMILKTANSKAIMGLKH